MKILVLGAGGTGGYFGGRLHQGGADVTFLVREARAQHIATHGLMLESPKDKITLQVKTVLEKQVREEQVKPKYDVVILSCKAYDLASSVEAITPAMGERTCVLPLLNGISHIATLDAAFGQQRVMGGACQISATLTQDGVVKSMLDSHALVWGARDPAHAGLAQELGKPFANTVLDWRVSATIMLDMWEKLTFLSTLAGMTCRNGPHAPPLRGSLPPEGAYYPRGGPSENRLRLARHPWATYSRRPAAHRPSRATWTRASPSPRKVAPTLRRFAGRCPPRGCIFLGAARRKIGHAPRSAAIERYRAMLSAPGSALTASMLRDLENGGPIEADHIVGFVLEKARAHGVDEGMLAVAYANLKAYEVRRGRGRAS